MDPAAVSAHPADRRPTSGRGGATTLSVTLCTYQGERFLESQLASLLSQTRPPSEIVIADDASTDSTWRMLCEFASQAKGSGVSVVLHRQNENVGLVKNFQSALERASGDLIFLCDQDDVWFPEKLATMATELARRPSVLMMFTDARLIGAGGEDLRAGLFEAFGVRPFEIDAVHRGEGFEVLLRRNIVTGATMVIRREVLEHALPIPPGWLHDEWLAMAAASCGEVDLLGRKMIGYRQHGGNQVGAVRRSTIEKVTGSRVPRREFMQRVLLRFESMLERVDAGTLPLASAKRDLLVARLEHARIRADLPGDPLARLSAVWREYRRAGYGRFSMGALSALGDLFGSRP